MCIPAQAQIEDLIDKVEERTFDKIDDEIDDAVEDVVEDALNDFFGIGKKQEENTKDTGETMNTMAEEAEDIEVRESFQFDKKIIWKVDNEDNETIRMVQLMPNSKEYLGTETNGIVSIQDFEKKSSHNYYKRKYGYCDCFRPIY